MITTHQINPQPLRLGIDVGSTTVKAVVLSGSDEVLYSQYVRHHARQIETAVSLLGKIGSCFPQETFRIAVCGSGGKPVADALGAAYVQEVIAGSVAMRRLYPQVRTAVELGGQDAKLIFFHYDESQGRLIASDMRMNGSCAGGTGAFLDEIASLLRVAPEEFEKLAAKGIKVHSISGRCGVFAKTDIQSVLNGGGTKEDIALSACHAIVRQTVGGLAQGIEIKPPVIFEGGPLTFNPTLVRAFAERLGLSKEEIIIPQEPQTFVARGAAMAIDELAGAAAHPLSAQQAVSLLEEALHAKVDERVGGEPFFASRQEQESWQLAHACPKPEPAQVKAGDVLRVYAGVDAGSTTTKLALIDEQERMIDSYYASNHGDPIGVAREGLLSLYRKYRDMGVTLQILGAGTTGYGEAMLACAIGADYHTVETVAHAAAATKYVKDASFILDIGGQDMKAIWLRDGVVTDMVLNEACSSGCGSFLEGFASSMGIPLSGVADAAFRSKRPALLGSRCTVFMNSTVITEQKNGATPEDIMAGLCRSIIENVFTKVVRIPSPDALGSKIVVQGGTFRNDAVLRALEQHLGRTVTRAPYPGEMGCIGAALLTKRRMERAEAKASTFIGFEALETLEYTRRENVVCPHCVNHCKRSMIIFSNGARYVTGNRCPRGEEIDDLPNKKAPRTNAKDLYQLREALLMKDYDAKPVCAPRNVTIGLPRALEFWDSMPFWTVFFKALGFNVKRSHASSRPMYEQGIGFVASDTVCFPAKLVHGHIQDLVEQKVDRIFMPMIMEMPAENESRKSDYVCAVVKGYPLQIHNSENPAARWGVAYDHPMFHWHTEADRKRQIAAFVRETFSVGEREFEQAFKQGTDALLGFRTRMHEEGQRIIADMQEKGSFAVVLAGRPYHNDPMVCHDLSRVFQAQGVPVLTLDSLETLSEADLSHTRAEITNNFHARMLSGAKIAAENPCLEYVQIVSFGCGHDAILSDEIARIMHECGDKTPLLLKLDEGAAEHALKIRVKSFLETVCARRRTQTQAAARPLTDAYPQKFMEEDKKLRTVLVPNVSAAFCKLLSGVMHKEGLKAEPLPVGGLEQIKLAKRYVHNDTCFPAQMVIGEALTALMSGKYDLSRIAVAMAKYQGDCRLSHYSALLRRALDEAGFKQVPIVSTDPEDKKNMHPGVRLNMLFNVKSAWAIGMMDILEELRRKIRPYEKTEGETNRVFELEIARIAQGIGNSIGDAMRAFKTAIDDFCRIEYDRSKPRRRVFVTGEYLVTFHEGSNFHIESYLEKHGLEVILPRMLNVFRKDYLSRLSEMKNFGVRYPLADGVSTAGGEGLFRIVEHTLDKIAKKHPLYHAPKPLPELAEETEPIMDRTFISGEGWLIPGEIREHALEGVTSFVVLQPFGCLPNHICGRGVMKKLKEEFPAIQILPLDLEPDTSLANMENRLQMLLMNEHSRAGQVCTS